MALKRSFEELRALLAGEQPLPESRFVTYNLPLAFDQLKDLEPLLKEGKDLKGLRLRWGKGAQGQSSSVSNTFWPHMPACAGAAVQEYFCPFMLLLLPL
jgi:hypothetical protein